MKKVGGHCGANTNVKYCWPKVICCMVQSNELKREIKQKKQGGKRGGQPKIWGSIAPKPLLRIATDGTCF